jgi:hypothetical protein
MRLMLVGVVLIALSVATPVAWVGPWFDGSRTSVGPQAGAPAQAKPDETPTPIPPDAQIEQFLREAKVIKTKTVGKGVTGSLRATLSDGTMTHDAQIQSIDEKKTQFEAAGAAEFNFEDSWKFNVAAYRVDRLIGLQMVPVSIPRAWKGQPSAFTWWIDDVMMDEGKRLKEKTQPPNSSLWNEQMQLVRVFDQLIYNVDRNMGNLLISTNWRVWAIDHTRAFRSHNTLKSPANVTRCDRQVIERLKQLNKDVLKKEIGEFVTDYQINGLLARRDKIVELIERAGPSAMFERHAY